MKKDKKMPQTERVFIETTHIVGLKLDFAWVYGLQLIVPSYTFHQNRLTAVQNVGVGWLIFSLPIPLAFGLYNNFYGIPVGCKAELT